MTDTNIATGFKTKKMEKGQFVKFHTSLHGHNLRASYPHLYTENSVFQAEHFHSEKLSDSQMSFGAS